MFKNIIINKSFTKTYLAILGIFLIFGVLIYKVFAYDPMPDGFPDVYADHIEHSYRLFDGTNDGTGYQLMYQDLGYVAVEGTAYSMSIFVTGIEQWKITYGPRIERCTYSDYTSCQSQSLWTEPFYNNVAYDVSAEEEHTQMNGTFTHWINMNPDHVYRITVYKNPGVRFYADRYYYLKLNLEYYNNHTYILGNNDKDPPTFGFSYSNYSGRVDGGINEMAICFNDISCGEQYVYPEPSNNIVFTGYNDQQTDVMIYDILNFKETCENCMAQVKYTPLCTDGTHQYTDILPTVVRFFSNHNATGMTKLGDHFYEGYHYSTTSTTGYVDNVPLKIIPDTTCTWTVTMNVWDISDTYNIIPIAITGSGDTYTYTDNYAPEDIPETIAPIVNGEPNEEACGTFEIFCWIKYVINWFTDFVDNLVYAIFGSPTDTMTFAENLNYIYTSMYVKAPFGYLLALKDEDFTINTVDYIPTLTIDNSGSVYYDDDFVIDFPDSLDEIVHSLRVFIDIVLGFMLFIYVVKVGQRF